MSNLRNCFREDIISILHMEVIRQDIEAKGLSEDILLDRNEWRKLIHVKVHLEGGE